jgi:YidC/Oxa1 family membrane protein insertase
MNKNDKLWVSILIAVLVGYLAWNWFSPKPVAPAMPKPVATAPAAPTAPSAVVTPAPVATVPEMKPAEQKFYVLSDDQVKLTFSDLGARLTKAELLTYRQKNSEDSAHVVLETGDLLNLAFDGANPYVKYAAEQVDDKTLVFKAILPSGVALERTVMLGEDYALTVRDAFLSEQGVAIAPYGFNAGSFGLTEQQGDTVGFDTLAAGEKKPEYHEGDLAKVLGARSAFLGCGTSSDPTGLPLMGTSSLAAPQTWIALKSRFFMSLVMPPVAAPCNYGVARDAASKTLLVNRVNASFTYPALQLTGGVPTGVVTHLYVGPKLLSNLKAFGNHAERVMDFGMFAWFCELMLPVLNFFYNLIPNYGVAIILLTLLVRAVFWPLTQKSTISMRKMSIVQPQIKELQAKFKDNPQKLQQETLKLYREHKVNPFSSCLPMLVQIPIFIALFTVLRSAVELRFADFLWIADLSQPENLFAGFLPVPLNILPILTAVTMGLQTHLSPSSGDPAQKKMMTWMMPIMLLFMFYSMPSALCLYWTVSQVLSIAQMWYIHKTTATTPANA